jgi:hypothetical protein
MVCYPIHALSLCSQSIVTQSAAHVTGVVAYLLGLLEPSSAAAVASALAAVSVKGALTGVPAGTANNLASINVTRIGIVV